MSDEAKREPQARSKAAAGLADAIEVMAARLLADSSQILTEIVEGAVVSVPGAIGGVITEHRPDGQVVERATFGRVPENFVSEQLSLGQGPTIDAAAGVGQMVVPDVATDGRWPRFSASVAGEAVHGVLAAPLALGGKVVGALTLLSDLIAPFDGESEDIALIFAAHAATTIAGNHREGHLDASRESRDEIGRAKGILMERHGLTDPAAFALLVRISKATNIKLITVARTLSTTGSLPTV